MDFTIYCVIYLLEAAFGFGMLLTVGAAVIWWQDRHKRAHYRYWNGHS